MSIVDPPSAATRARLGPDLPQRFLEPPGFAWREFLAADGARLRGGHLAAAAPRAACLLVGGFCEFVEKYFETIADLRARRLSVWCLDWRGQGGSERPPLLPSRPRRRDFARDAADLAGFAGAMLPPGLPRLLIGHSMGGAIALLALQRHRGLFDAAILSAPMLGLPAAGWPPALARFLTRLADAAGLGTMFIPGARRWEAEAESGEQSRTTHDAERARIQPAWFAANPDLVVDGPTFGFVASAFGLVDRLAEPDFLAAIETPVLIGSPNIESFVDPASHRRAAAHLRNCRVFDMPGSKHEPFLESDVFRDRWLAAIDAFVAERLAKI